MKTKIISHAVAIAVGIGVAMYFDKDMHEIKKEVVYKDRVYTVTKEVIKENPDGTRTIERQTEKAEKKDKVATHTESKPVKKNWGVGVKYDLVPLSSPVWTVEVQRRIIGNFYLGAYGRTDGVAGVGVTLLF